MRRADRLFQIVQILRGGRLVTAAALAARLEVSERTIYRDMRDLMASGVPVDGEAGTGYLLRDGYDLPPLMFTAAEVEALVVGGRMVRSWAGGTLSRAAAGALEKIEAAMPDALRQRMRSTPLHVPDFQLCPEIGGHLDLLREAIGRRRLVMLEYCRADGTPSRRKVQPLGLHFWGKVWTLAAWCSLRGDFRMFRVDRMAGVTVLDSPWPDIPGRSLADFLRSVGADPHP